MTRSLTNSGILKLGAKKSEQNRAAAKLAPESKFPKGGMRLIMTGQNDTRRDPKSMLITVKGGMLINLGKNWRGRSADMNPEGRAATRRRRQMEARS